MSANNPTDTTDDTQRTEPMSAYEITIDMLRRPGQLFEVGGCTFLTAGGVGTDGLNVIRTSTGGREQLDTTLLEEDIEKGDLQLLGTHSTHTEVSVNRQTLATLLQYVQYDIEEIPDRVTSDERDAVVDAAEQLD